MVAKYKRGTVFRNKHTFDFFAVTAWRKNCGFPIYYLKLVQRSPDTYFVKVTQDESQMLDNWIEWTQTAQVLYGQAK